jgi:hypothetical protein
MKYVLALIAVFILISPVQARTAQGCVSDNNGRMVCRGLVERTKTRPIRQAKHEKQHIRRVERHIARSEHVVGGRPSGCPYRWCGCGVSLKVFGKIIPELNLASNWRRFPAAIALAGMAAWRPGHVFYIMAVNGDGTVLAYDPNSGHSEAHIHNRSLRGFRVVDPHGGRYASRLFGLLQ